MAKFTNHQIALREPTILDSEQVMDMRTEFLTTYCKFNGTSNLDIYDDYLDWLAHTIKLTNGTTFNRNDNSAQFTYLVIDVDENTLLGMVEIVFYYDAELMQKRAHIVECVRPSKRRQGYGKPLLKKAIDECNSWGIKKDRVTYERNSKASSETMNALDF